MPASLGPTGIQVSMGKQVGRGRLEARDRPVRTARMGGLARKGYPGTMASEGRWATLARMAS